MTRFHTIPIIAASLAAALAWACTDASPFQCNRDPQCTRGDEVGVCEGAGYCSFTDPSCPEGRRFADNAGDGLAGTCTGTPAACGAIGEACCDRDVCTNGAACGAQGTCVSCMSELAPGRRHTCAVRHDRTIWCWGDNDQGQLGNGDDAIGAGGPEPVQVVDANRTPLTGATYVAAGYDHSCAVVAGHAWCWGANDSGKLGDGTSTMVSATAVEVITTASGEPLEDIIRVGLGDAHSCALTSLGEVYCWGYNEGRLGDGTTATRGTASPVVVANGAPLGGVVDLSVNGRHACVRSASDRVWCWGQNNDGETGVGHRDPVLEATEVFESVHVTAGRRHTCAATATGEAMCWGQSWRGTLGNSDDVWTPVLVPGVVLTIDTREPVADVAGVAAGAAACYWSSAGEAFCWGPGSYGQLGSGAGAYYATPVLSSPSGPPLTGVTRLVSHHSRTCAFLDDGRVVCWGRNSEGQLGDGTTENRGFPTEVRCP